MTTLENVLVDTSFLVALLNTEDPYHHVALEKVNLMRKRTWVSSHLVLHETYYILKKRASQEKALSFLSFANKRINFYSLPTNWIVRASEIIKKFHDAEIDLTDATLVIVAEELNHGDILSTDGDFNYLRWGKRNFFNNLLQS